MTTLLKPKEAAQLLGISRPTITRCVQRGAPVHYWGSVGRYYRIDPEEFVAWMEAQGPIHKLPEPVRRMDVQSMAERNRAALAAMLSEEVKPPCST